MTPAQLSLIRRFTYPRCAHSEVWLLANARNIDKCDRRICRLWDVSGNEAAEDQSALLDFGVLSHGRGKGVKIPFKGKVIDEESGLRVFRAVPSEIVGDNAVYFAFGYCRPVLTVFQQYLEESTPAFQLYLSTAAATIDVAEETSPTVGNGRRRRASASGRDYLKDVDSVSEGDDDNLVPAYKLAKVTGSTGASSSSNFFAASWRYVPAGAAWHVPASPTPTGDPTAPFPSYEWQPKPDGPLAFSGLDVNLRTNEVKIPDLMQASFTIPSLDGRFIRIMAPRNATLGELSELLVASGTWPGKQGQGYSPPPAEDVRLVYGGRVLDPTRTVEGVELYHIHRDVRVCIVGTDIEDAVAPAEAPVVAPAEATARAPAEASAGAPVAAPAGAPVVAPAAAVDHTPRSDAQGRNPENGELAGLYDEISVLRAEVESSEETNDLLAAKLADAEALLRASAPSSSSATLTPTVEALFKRHGYPLKYSDGVPIPGYMLEKRFSMSLTPPALGSRPTDHQVS